MDGFCGVGVDGDMLDESGRVIDGDVLTQGCCKGRVRRPILPHCRCVSYVRCFRLVIVDDWPLDHLDIGFDGAVVSMLPAALSLVRAKNTRTRT